jgi:hypothetical protein
MICPRGSIDLHAEVGPMRELELSHPEGATEPPGPLFQFGELIFPQLESTRWQKGRLVADIGRHHSVMIAGNHEVRDALADSFRN